MIGLFGKNKLRRVAEIGQKQWIINLPEGSVVSITDHALRLLATTELDVPKTPKRSSELNSHLKCDLPRA